MACPTLTLATSGLFGLLSVSVSSALKSVPWICPLAVLKLLVLQESNWLVGTYGKPGPLPRMLVIIPETVPFPKSAMRSTSPATR